MTKYFKEACSYMDLGDKETLAIVSAVNEADQRMIMMNVSNKIYDFIKLKANEVDFGDIPLSKGDVQRLRHYKLVKQTLDALERLCDSRNIQSKALKTTKEALANLEKDKYAYVGAFMRNLDYPCTIYNFTVLSIIASTSMMVSAITEYIMDNEGTTKFAMDSKHFNVLDDNVVIKNLERFNENSRNGKLAKALSLFTKAHARGILGTMAAVSMIGAGIYLIFNIIPILREIVYYFYFCRTSLAEYLEVQASMLEINASKIEYDDDMKDAADYQRDVAVKFRRYADKLDINDKAATAKMSKEIKEEDSSKTKFKHDDISDSIPDSAGANSSLF